MLTVGELKRLHICVSSGLQDGECICRGLPGSERPCCSAPSRISIPTIERSSWTACSERRYPPPDWQRRVTYLAAEPGWWSDAVQEHFSAREAALPLVARLGLPHDCRAGRSGDFRRARDSDWGLCGGLMLRSRVLLLDEPTSALDSASAAAVEALIAERVADGTSVIWSSRQPPVYGLGRVTKFFTSDFSAATTPLTRQDRCPSGSHRPERGRRGGRPRPAHRSRFA